MEGLELVYELAIILIAAGVFTVISKALKQPLILGYIIAGFLVGPHLGLFPKFNDTSVDDWAEIGIIFLLFSLGLEFSLKKLIKVGNSALVAAGTKCVGMFFVGIVVGNVMGWTMMESIFLGGLLSMSSTTVIIKTYDDLGMKDRPYASLIFGSLVFEDLIAVLLMVLLSTLAVSNTVAGDKLVFALAKLAFFIVLWFVVGIYLVPTILRKTRKYLSDEILLIVSIGVCFGMVVVANMVGFSSALGAFVMGSILAETMEGEHISKLTASIKDLFGAIFFVSIGMLVDPAVLVQHWPSVLVITLVAMSGILVFSFIGVIISGKGLDAAVHAGFSLAQLGEFAFIIAGVGCTLGVMRDFIYPVVVTVSVITTFTTPYMIKAADPVAAWLRRKLPESVLRQIDPPQNVLHSESRAERREWASLLKSYFIRIGIYGVVLTAILIASRTYLADIVRSIVPGIGEAGLGWVCVIITILVMLPFLYGLAVTNGSINKPAKKLYNASGANKWTIVALINLRIMIAVLFVVMAITTYFSLAGWSLVFVIAVAFIVLMVFKFTMRQFTVFETRFMRNFNALEEYEKQNAPVTTAINEKMSDYDVRIERVLVSSDFVYAGKTLREMPFRHTTGVNIVKIVRGSKGIEIPSGDERIFPGDVLLAVGTTEQIALFRKVMEDNSVVENAEVSKDAFVVDSVTLTAGSHLTGQTLRESKMRASGCMVVGVLHNGELIANPKPEYLFREGDTVWMAGAQSSIEWFK